MSPTKAIGRPRTLDDGAVVDAALALLDSGGQAAMSIRAVAGRLGVAPNSIYTYVADRQALEGAVVDRVLAEGGVTLLDGPPAQWRERITSYALSLRGVLLSHPGAVGMFMTAPMNGPAAVAVGEALLRCLTDAGLRPSEASRGVYAVIVHVLGSTALEVAETDDRPPLPPESQRVEERRQALAAVNPQWLPLTAATVDTAATWITGEQFSWGLDALLDGITNPRRAVSAAPEAPAGSSDA